MFFKHSTLNNLSWTGSAFCCKQTNASYFRSITSVFSKWKHLNCSTIVANTKRILSPVIFQVLYYKSITSVSTLLLPIIIRPINTCTPKFNILLLTCLFLFVFLHMTRIEVFLTQQTSGNNLTSQTGVKWNCYLTFCLLSSLVLKIRHP